MNTRMFSLGGMLLMGMAVGAFLPVAQAQRPRQPATLAASSAERTVWYFYRVKWGHEEEFLELYRRNHYPVMKAQLGDRITAIRAYRPTYHGDGRADWTFATALTFRDTAAMTGPSREDEIARRLFPDQDTFRKEERRRFEILDAHWDVPLTEVPMEPMKED
ncbi:MAG: hypothetical protein ACE5JI_14400 [Acidobacteriota bacterium]